MSLSAHCDSCERPIKGDGYYSAPHAATFCASCCGAILSAEVERLTDQHRRAVSTIETHLHEPPRAPKGIRQADFRRGWEAARQAALIALGGAEREYPE
jgi:hypothetical protein